MKLYVENKPIKCDHCPFFKKTIKMETFTLIQTRYKVCFFTEESNPKMSDCPLIEMEVNNGEKN